MKLSRIFRVIAIAALLLFVGCDRSPNTKEQPAPTPAPPAKIVPFNIGMVTFAGYAPLYLAKEKGFFGPLDVKLVRALVLVVVEQYTIFPKRIIEILMEARDRVRESIKSSTAGGDARQPRSENAPAALYRVESELLRNIGQELGSESKGKKHYDMLVDGLKAYGMRNVRSARPHGDSTSRFIDAMLDAIDHDKTLLFNLGAVYAMENTAVPELKIVRAIVLGVFKPACAAPA